MRPVEVTYRPEAIADLQAIYDWLAELSHSEGTARRFVQRIMARCRKIAIAPRGGRPRDDLKPGIRTVPFERSAVIAYIVENDRVVITNIFYGGRNYDALYSGSVDSDPSADD